MWVCRPSLFLCLCLWHQITTWGTCQVKLSSACGILAYSVHCSRELEPDFVSFCLFLIGCHRSISTALLSAFEPMDFTPFFFFNLRVAIYSLNPLFQSLCKESLRWQCLHSPEGEAKEAWKLCLQTMWGTQSTQGRVTFQYRDLLQLFYCLCEAFLRIARPMPSTTLHPVFPLKSGVS